MTRSAALPRLLLAVAALAVATPAPAPAAEPEVRVLKEGYKAGFRDCAAAAEKVVRFIHEDDSAYGYIATWATKKTNESMLGAVTSESYADGQGVTTFSAVKAASGGCDVSATQTLMIPEKPCDELRKASFADWKDYTEIDGLPVLSDPRDPNASLTLMPIGKTGCVLVKHLIAFGVE